MDLTNLPLMANTAIVFGLIFLLMGSGLWVSLSLAAVGIFTLVFLAGGLQALINSLLFTALNSFVLCAAPLFIFMGELLLKSGVSTNLYDGVSRWTRVLPGGLVHANIVACSLFAAVSGSSVATSATIGSVALADQEKRGYDRRLVMGSIAAGGTLGILIPPSVIMILYGAFVGQSVARLFVGGFIPGIIMSIMFMMWTGFAALVRPSWTPGREKLTWSYFPGALKGARELWPLWVLIIIIFGGIYGGIMTPTEAAAVACFATLVIVAIHKKLTFAVVKEAGLAALRLAAMLNLIILGAIILQNGLSMIRLPAQITALILSTGAHKYLIWFLICLMYLILGCFMEGFSMLLLTLPIAYPLVVDGLGFDPIWFGVMLTILVQIALITPPVGMNLYVIMGIAGGGRFREVVIGIIPFLIIMFICTALYTVYPWLVTWLPNLIFQ